MIKEKQEFEMADGRILVADWTDDNGMAFRNVMSIHYSGEPEGMAAKRAFFLGNNAQPEPVYKKVLALAEDEVKNSWIQKAIRAEEAAARMVKSGERETR
jgi:hypothetical protein